MKSTTEFHEIAVFGAHGHSVMVLQGLEDLWRGRVRVRALIDDLSHGFQHPALGVPVISSDERLARFPDLPVLVTVYAPALRARVFARLAAEGAVLATVPGAPGTHVDPGVVYGPGSIVAPHTRLGPAVRIGTGGFVMAELVAHDVEIGDFTTLGPYCTVLGHAVIGRDVNIAPRAIIGNGTADRPLRIGDGAVIGVGAVVARDVPAGARMVGNPAMTVERWRALNRLLDGA